MPRRLRPQFARLVVFITCLAMVASSACAGKSAVKMTKLTGSVELTTEEPVPFTLSGVASHLGNFSAVGEIQFEPGEEEGSFEGEGVVVFKASNGDLLVGNATWKVGPPGGEARITDIHFAWAEAVEFSNGVVVTNTGRFTDNRPPGLAVVTESNAPAQPAPNIVILILIAILR